MKVFECPSQLYGFPDPEAELAAVDNFYPRLLEELNRAKIDYNFAADHTVDPNHRAFLAERYMHILSRGHLLYLGVELRTETYAKRPMLALLVEHSISLTIEWMRLATNGQLIISGTKEDFGQWAERRIESELEFVRYFREEVERVQRGRFVKTS